ncbi:unnamed protein product [Symbiodinium sp. CCMP2592]|nr:unnamed protein product [Symbiodinium sp. CCMP2592]
MDTEDGVNKTPTAPTPTATPTSPSPSDAGRKLRRASIQPVLDGNGERRPITVTGNFIRAGTAHESEGDARAPLQHFVDRLIKIYQSPYFANFMAFVIILDAFCACQDIDARAANAPPPSLWMTISDICLALYTFELAGTLYLRKWAGLREVVVIVDVFIVLAGYAELLMQAVAEQSLNVNMQVMRVLRLARIIRLMRLLKKVRAFRELFKLVTMMSTCFLTLLWSFLFCFLVMTGWAMLMVEYVHPLVTQMTQNGAFDECGDQCLRSTSSVMDANLLLFKTVVAGDSWGEIAVPVIQLHPETAIIFVGSSLTLVFGVLNLIVAVIVDTFAEARSNEFDDLAEELNDDVEYDRKELQKLFDRIDRDGTGRLSLDDLVQGARTDPSFQSRLRVMDIDEHDLHQLFLMIDADGSGYIEAHEFVGPLSRWVHDSKTAPRFIKYNMMQSLQLQEEIYDMAQEHFDSFAVQLREMSKSLHKLTNTDTCSSLSDSGDERGNEVQPLIKNPEPEAAPEEKAEKGTACELEAELKATAEKLEVSLNDTAFEVGEGLRKAFQRLEVLLSEPKPSPIRRRSRRLDSDSSASLGGGFRDRRSLFKQMYVKDEGGVADGEPPVRGVVSVPSHPGIVRTSAARRTRDLNTVLDKQPIPRSPRLDRAATMGRSTRSLESQQSSGNLRPPPPLPFAPQPPVT